MKRIILLILLLCQQSQALTITKGYTFGATEVVTAAKLHSLIESATITGISATDIGASAIGSTQLAANAVTTAKILDGTILGADLAARTITSSLIATGAVTSLELSTNITWRAGFQDFTAVTVTNLGVGTSAGAADSNKNPKLNSTGKLDSSFLDVGISGSGLATKATFSTNLSGDIALPTSIYTNIFSYTTTLGSNTLVMVSAQGVDVGSGEAVGVRIRIGDKIFGGIGDRGTLNATAFGHAIGSAIITSNTTVFIDFGSGSSAVTIGRNYTSTQGILVSNATSAVFNEIK